SGCQSASPVSSGQEQGGVDGSVAARRALRGPSPARFRAGGGSIRIANYHHAPLIAKIRICQEQNVNSPRQPAVIGGRRCAFPPYGTFHSPELPRAGAVAVDVVGGA